MAKVKDISFGLIAGAALFGAIWLLARHPFAAGLMLALPIALYAVAYTALAPNDWFVTFRPEEGKVKIVVRGADEKGRGGVFVRFIMNWKDYTLDEENNVVLASLLGPGARKKWHDELLGYLGLAWVGIPLRDSVYQYRFKWAEYEQQAEGKYKLRLRDELTELVFLKPTQYVVVAPEAEVKGNVPVDFKYVLTVRVTNPYRAIFVADSWLVRLATAANGAIIPWLRTKEFEEINTGSDQEMVRRVLTLNTHNRVTNNGLDLGLEDEFGIRIDDVEIAEFDPKGGEKLREALVARKIAVEQATARKEEAGGEAAFIRETGKAEAKRLKALLKETEGKSLTALVGLALPSIAESLFRRKK